MVTVNWSKVWDWTKRVGGVVVTSLLVPYVSNRYGDGWGAVVGAAGAGAVHQAERFRKKQGRKTDPGNTAELPAPDPGELTPVHPPARRR